MRYLLTVCIGCLLCLSTTAQTELPLQPTVDEVATYLRHHLGEPPDGFISYFWTQEPPIQYMDLNDDGSDDLVAVGWLFVAIMLRQGEQYSEPKQFIYTGNPTDGTWSSVSLLDWTLDGIPEVMLDRRYPIIGNGIGGERWERTIISCASRCQIAWEGEIARYVRVSGEAGIYLSETEMQASKSPNDTVILRTIQRDFAFNCQHSACTVARESIAQDGFQPRSRVGATIQTRYLWNGMTFLRHESRILVASRAIRPITRLQATTQSGHTATIAHDNGICQLWLGSDPLDAPFNCVLEFVSIHWMDELLILEYAYFTEETIVIYDGTGNLIRQVSGAIRDENLFGVQLDRTRIFSAGNRYMTPDPHQPYWFTLNDTTILMNLSFES